MCVWGGVRRRVRNLREKCLRAWGNQGSTPHQHTMLELASGSNTPRPYEHTAKFMEPALTPPPNTERKPGSQIHLQPSVKVSKTTHASKDGRAHSTPRCRLKRSAKYQFNNRHGPKCSQRHNLDTTPTALAGTNKYLVSELHKKTAMREMKSCGAQGARYKVTQAVTPFTGGMTGGRRSLRG